MKILIIEDEPPAARRLERLLTSIIPDLDIVNQLDSIEISIEFLQESPELDLIFLDIELADGKSFEIFKEVEITTPVIFTTAYDEYALQAFQTNSIDYLLKPINEEKLQQALHKYQNLKEKFAKKETSQMDWQPLLDSLQAPQKKYKSRFLVKLGDKLIPVLENEIAFIFSEDKVSFLVTENSKKYPIDYSLDDLEELLNNEYFFRLNRQVIARLESIRQIHNYFNGKLKIDLEPNILQEVIVSREKAKRLKEWLDM